MGYFARRWPHPPQPLHRPQYPLPHRKPVQVASLKHGIGTHGGMDQRVLAVVLYEDVSGAVDVERPDIAGLGAAELRPFT